MICVDVHVQIYAYVEIQGKGFIFIVCVQVVLKMASCMSLVPPGRVRIATPVVAAIGGCAVAPCKFTKFSICGIKKVTATLSPSIMNNYTPKFTTPSQDLRLV